MFACQYVFFKARSHLIASVATKGSKTNRERDSALPFSVKSVGKKFSESPSIVYLPR